MKQETLDRVHVVATLPSGKEIGYKEIGQNRFKQICFKSGGEIPKELQGMWTDPMSIEKAIKSYVIQMENKAESKAEKKPKKTK